jgi:hypothetical protein
MRRTVALLLVVGIVFSPHWAFAQRGAPPALDVAEGTAACLTNTWVVGDGVTRPAWVEAHPHGYRVVLELRGQPETARHFPLAPAENVLAWFDMEQRDDPNHTLILDPSPDGTFAAHRGGSAYVARPGGFQREIIASTGLHCLRGALGVL